MTDVGLIVKGSKKRGRSKLYEGAPEVVFFPVFFLHVKTENKATLAVSCARFILFLTEQTGNCLDPH